ncbi:cobalamin biosynthesis protein CobW [Methylocystis sp. MJC1]|jgi:cobalamin biosynthesis protein CobW|uniref:cobalamin biosynthesis protein CobW n=1 Tax=Methylocystis sp. MJC1 TaxID=2654282 RepID=UPI0013EB11D5|nr:cobalamin biosynthesis protein CobW [Methylocystis sp. MJC1]KAF2990969.1 putative GTP-binding protein YjiA [Methylocystis sp. MJC1]MBU6527860.1 cobalamin biosynthesis protein CobW [Methylocystis sp. MJC1]UZX10781.1 cobalamin biosynthesis protein CobW [Methylocystis sp. MJC1]
MSAAKIPATIVTGFLGAGKTTLIRHVLENARDRRLALVINEFGDVGVDGDILRACGVENCPEENIVELANGCLCCTVADDFVPAIEALLAHEKRPDHIIIETSGLALPKPLVKAFDWPAIRSKLTVDGVIAVIDGKAVAEGRFADDLDAIAQERAETKTIDHDNPLEEVFEDQLACADLVILNKTDLLDDAEEAAVVAQLTQGARESVKVVRAREGRVDPLVLLGLAAAAEDDLANRPSHHDAETEHDHDDFDSFVVSIPAISDPATLVTKLVEAARMHDVLRVKGFVEVAGKPMRLLVQGVGARVQHHFDRPWKAGEERASRLVVIGEKGLDRESIAAMLAQP